MIKMTLVNVRRFFISLISIIINSHELPTKHETLKTTCYSINIKKEFMKKQRKIFHILVLEAYLHSFEDIEIHGMMMGFSWNCSGLIWIPDYDISIRPRSYHTWTKQLELGLSPVKLTTSNMFSYILISHTKYP